MLSLEWVNQSGGWGECQCLRWRVLEPSLFLCWHLLTSVYHLSHSHTSLLLTLATLQLSKEPRRIHYSDCPCEGRLGARREGRTIRYIRNQNQWDLLLVWFLYKGKKMTGLAVDQELEAVSQPRSKSAESSYASICGLIAPSLFS